MALPRRGARLADIQAQQTEVGRIRLGTSQQKTSRAGKAYNEPVKLERFRLTSRSERLIKEAAILYGGTPEPWTPQTGGAAQWQVIVESTSIPVIVPPDPCSQFYEQWIAGRCTRRCDGVRELLEDVICPCGPDPMGKKSQGCKPTTRVSLMLADMNGIGVWRLETHGYYAAAELPAVVDLLSAAGGNVPARLEMEERSAQIPDPRNPGRTVASRFMVPVLHVGATPATIVGALVARPAIGAAAEHLALEAGADGDPGPDREPTAEDDNKLAWTVYGHYEEVIAAAGDRDAMLAARNDFREDQRLPQEFKENLNSTWMDKAKRMASQQQQVDPSPPAAAPVPSPAAPSRPAPAPAQPAAPPPPSSPAAGGADRDEDRNDAFQRVLQAAGKLGLGMSQVRLRYQAMTGGGDIGQANAGDLNRFKLHLESQQ